MLSRVSLPVAAASQAELPRNLEGACRALEKEFAQLVFQKMRQAMVPATSEGANGFSRETSMSMLDGQWAELASQGEGLGLWRSMARQLSAEAGKVDRPAGRSEDQVETRTEADREPQGSAGIPGPRPGHSRPAAAAAARPGVPGLSGSTTVRVADAPSADPEEL